MRKLFGTDGIRGIANKELTPEITFKIGRAASYVLMNQNKNNSSILLGTDTRISGSMLEAALVSGICSIGTKAICIGVVPTPAIAYLTKKYNMNAGIMISASHNEAKDNGIKFFGNKGYKLSDYIENKIETIILDEYDKLPRPIGENIGFRTKDKTLICDYVEFLKSTMEDINLKNIKIAVDCANGATYKLAPEILKKLGAQVYILNNKPDGLNINKECGSTNMEKLSNFVKENNVDIGIAYDGDGDRCLLVDENGNIVNGDEILSICSVYLKNKNRLKKDTIVCTVMTNLGLLMMAKEKNINVEISDVGDRYVLEKMLEGGYNLGGEQSGHIIFSDYNTTGDGILTSLQVLKIIKDTNKTLSQLNKQMKLMPQVVVSAVVDNSKKNICINDNEIKKEIDKVKNNLKDEGRILVRSSGTEPLIRIMIEGKDKNIIKNEAERIAKMFEKLYK